MQSTAATLALLSLLGFSSAIPTPVELAPRCGTTSTPSFLQALDEANPTVVGANSITTDGSFTVSQDVDSAGNIINRIYEVAGFSNIPSGSYACQLAVTFPSNYPITSSGNPILNVTTLYNGDSVAVTYPNNLSWSALFPPTSPPFRQGLFGTVTMQPGTTQVINSETCPVGGGNLAFVFSIAGWEDGKAGVEFMENVHIGPDFAGVYLTYNC